MDVYASRLEELLQRIEEKRKEIPYIDNLLAIKGIGMATVSGFIAGFRQGWRKLNPVMTGRLEGMGQAGKTSAARCRFGQHTNQVSNT